MNNNTFYAKNPQKVYKESTFVWSLFYSETRYNLDSDKYPYTQTFPEMKNKWKGLLYMKEEKGKNYKVVLFLNAEETIDIKYDLLALDYRIDLIDGKKGNITIHKKTKPEDFKLCCILLIPYSKFTPDCNFISIKVNILEKMSEIQKDICETNVINESNKTLKNDLKILFENKKFSDFVIKLNDSDGIPVHRTILAARSPVFSAMFENDSLEKNEGYVKITDMDKVTLILLLNFIYMENFASDLSVEEVKKLLSAADKYAILDLKRMCGKYLENKLEISNAIDTLLLSEFYIVPELKNRVFEFIIDNKDRFMDPIKFEKVGKRFPNLLTELVMKTFVTKT